MPAGGLDRSHAESRSAIPQVPRWRRRGGSPPKIFRPDGGRDGTGSGSRSRPQYDLLLSVALHLRGWPSPGVGEIRAIRCGVPDGGVNKETHRERCRDLRRPEAKASAIVMSLFLAISEPPDAPKSKIKDGLAAGRWPPRSRATNRLTYSASDIPKSRARR
jgi:hypothetical protein